jgi:thiosulfate reductase cytochrome b subunit
MPLKSSIETGRKRRILRHPAFVRVTHWINVVALTGLLMSGLQIFNAHPALYWGKDSHFDTPILSVRADAQGTRGITTIFGHAFDTTGWLGLSVGPSGQNDDRGFPSWVTLPGIHDLATGRRWHFFFAWIFVLNGLAYLLLGFLRGHFRRDLLPSGQQLHGIGLSIREHLLLRFPKGDEARRYNVLQKLAYLSVVFILLPLIVLGGWAMSPGLNAAVPQLVDVLGGRQSARTIHFVVAFALVLFVAIHVAMVLLSGVWNNLRAMITGRYDIELGDDIHDAKPKT